MAISGCGTGPDRGDGSYHEEKSGGGAGAEPDAAGGPYRPRGS